MCKMIFTMTILCMHQIHKSMSEQTNITPIEQFVINEVRRRRMEKNISQRNLAYLLDVSVGFIGNVENPKYRAKYNIAHLNELAKILECSPQDFLPKKAL